jgi:uncharacterized membrane protein YccC
MIARPLSFAGIPMSAWAFGVRIWLAIVVALAASFWLELEAPSTAALTVAILAELTRGEALHKAYYRLIGTVIGVTAAIAITALLSQARDLLIVAFAGWIGLCVCAAGLVDGGRAYAAVLSGYTVAFIAIQQIDTPENVFETGMARGAAIAIGIAAVTLVNDLLATPASFPQLASRLAALHRRVRAYEKSVFPDKGVDASTAAGLLSDIAAIRSSMASLAAESASGSIRSVAARSTAVALVAQMYAARALRALSATVDPTLRGTSTTVLDPSGDPPQARAAMGRAEADPRVASAFSGPLAAQEFLRRDAEVCEGLAALNAEARPRRTWRAPLYRSQRIAIAAGIRAAICFALPSTFFILAGWPATDVSLSLVAVVIGLGATTPDPRRFTVLAFIGAPLAAVLAGALEFLILDGVNEFALLALGLAPFVIGTAVLMTRSNQLMSGLARVVLIFLLAIFAPSNPPSYNPQTFLFTFLFVWAAAALLLAAQILVPIETNERRRRWILKSVRRDFEHVLSRADRRLAPEEAMFRDAARIGQILASEGCHNDSALEVALSLFDRAAAIRLGRANAARLAETSPSHLATQVPQTAEDTQRLRKVSLPLSDAGGTESAGAKSINAESMLAATVMDTAKRAPSVSVTAS